MGKIRLVVDLRRLKIIIAGYRLPRKESSFVILIAGYLEGAYSKDKIRKMLQALQDYFEPVQ